MPTRRIPSRRRVRPSTAQEAARVTSVAPAAPDATDEPVPPPAPVAAASWRDYGPIDDDLLDDLRDRVACGGADRQVPVNGVIPHWLDKRLNTFVERHKQASGRRRVISKQAVLIEALLLWFASVPMPPRVEEEDEP